MNKAFKTNAMSGIKGRLKAIEYFKWLAGQSCHIVVNPKNY